jgi:predicted phage terminase large subunit-like protein
MLIFGVDNNDDIYLLDTWWDKQPADKAVDAMISLIKKWKPLIWWAEKGHISKAIGPFLRKRMAEEKAYCRIEEVTPTANKVQRSQSIQGRIAMGKVYFPKTSPWTQKAIDEILKFPNARHDDFVDTISYIGMGLNRFATPGQQMRAQSDVPKVGTLAWIKYDSKMRERDRKARDETGGF